MEILKTLQDLTPPLHGELIVPDVTGRVRYFTPHVWDDPTQEYIHRELEKLTVNVKVAAQEGHELGISSTGQLRFTKTIFDIAKRRLRSTQRASKFKTFVVFDSTILDNSAARHFAWGSVTH